LNSWIETVIAANGKQKWIRFVIPASGMLGRRNTMPVTPQSKLVMVPSI